MRTYIIDRVIEEGNYLAETGATVRKAASIFHLGKSTVHKDVTVMLKKIDFSLYLKVKKVLEKNLKERHVRGGLATKLKYQRLKKIVDKKNKSV